MFWNTISLLISIFNRNNSMPHKQALNPPANVYNILAMHYHISILFFVLCCIPNNIILQHIQTTFWQYIMKYPYKLSNTLQDIYIMLETLIFLITISLLISIFNRNIRLPVKQTLYPLPYVFNILAMHYHVSILFFILRSILNNTVL